jgi:hypothetical protein
LLDKEWGNQDIRGRVWLRNAGSQGSADDERYTEDTVENVA